MSEIVCKTFQVCLFLWSRTLTKSCLSIFYEFLENEGVKRILSLAKSLDLNLKVKLRTYLNKANSVVPRTPNGGVQIYEFNITGGVWHYWRSENLLPKVFNNSTMFIIFYFKFISRLYSNLFYFDEICFSHIFTTFFFHATVLFYMQWSYFFPLHLFVNMLFIISRRFI